MKSRRERSERCCLMEDEVWAAVMIDEEDGIDERMFIAFTFLGWSIPIDNRVVII
jgi:hypothetical protein